MNNYFTSKASFIGNDFESLLKDVIFIMPNWKWLILILLFASSFILRRIFQSLIVHIKKRFITDRKNSFTNEFLKLDLDQPMSWIFLSVFWLVTIDFIVLSTGLDKYLTYVFKIILIFNILKVCYMAVDAVGALIYQVVTKSENNIDDQLAPFAIKSLRILVIVLGVLLSLQNLGINVMSLIAGLGLGGLALALAAQDTAANFFGLITIFMDKPFKIGDWIKVTDTEGFVEEVGFRSTKIRTFYNSLITIPNSTIAKEKIDNMGARPLRRLRHNLGIHYDTPTTKIIELQYEIKKYLASLDFIRKEDIVVVLNNLGDFSLNILINCHILVSATDNELEMQNQILCSLLDICRQMQVEIPYPTRTVYYKNQG